jgi:hypothetical protein
MSPERIPNAPYQEMSKEKMETGADVEARLLRLGWTEEQVGKFAAAIQTMADAMIRGNAEGAAGPLSIELAIIPGDEGEEVAEVTLEGAGKGMGPEQIAGLIDNEELPVGLLTEASTEFFADKNKVVLRRKKDRPVEVDIK